MESIGINCELTSDQFEQLRSALGAEFNLVEVLSAWAGKKLNAEGDLRAILNCFSIKELETLRFKEFTVFLSEPLKKQINRLATHAIDDVVFKILSQLTKRNPNAELLSQTEVAIMLSDMDTERHSYGPSGLFKCSKLFSGSAEQMELIGVQIVMKEYLFNNIGILAKNASLNSVEELIQQKLKQWPF